MLGRKLIHDSGGIGDDDDGLRWVRLSGYGVRNKGYRI